MKIAFREAGHQRALMEAALHLAMVLCRLTGVAVMKVAVTWVVAVERRQEVTLAATLAVAITRGAVATLAVVVTVTSQAAAATTFQAHHRKL